MLQDRSLCTLLLGISVLFILLFSSCSNQKNTAVNRFYHSINTRYNIHFNAEEAYKETLKTQNNAREDNLSEMLYIFPDNSDSTSTQYSSGSYTTTIDKATKAIKLHSIKAKPKRDPNRRNDPEYQAWLQQKEYTPFMDKVWLLLAKAEFQEGNYLRAITTFMYISKIYSTNPNIVAECQLWVARAYTEMGWMYEASNILYKMETGGGIPENQKTFYSAVKANYLIRNNDLTAAIPHLERSLKKEKDKQQKLRMKYLLGQLYVETGDKVKADKAFASVHGMNTPYKYSFNAKLQQLQLNTSQSRNETVASLTKMGKSQKNKEYLDQIYYTIGNLYLNSQDTVKAIDNYKKAIKEGIRDGYDKMIAEVTLADLYFDRREFIPAQPLYSEALTKIKKSHEAYPRVALRSDVLDELVVHVVTVYTQDSLQHLAQLPEEERLTIINKKIEELKKEDEEKLKNEAREKQVEESQNRINTWADLESASNNAPVIPIPSQNDNTNSFYFYNDQAVKQGKIAFQKQWGNRKLEDDWRRRNKSSIPMDMADLDENDTDSLLIAGTTPESGNTQGKKTVEDIYSIDYYLQQLPLSSEAKKESDELIENALFNMGKIYKDKLEDRDLAVDAFETDIRRFPYTPNLEEIYYQLLLIYMQSGNNSMMETYRNRLLSEFPNGKYATPLAESNYEWNFRHMPIIEDSLYTAAYNAYLTADVQTVRTNYQDMKTKYPLTEMMPKFEFLNALSYAQTRDIKNLEDNLKELTDKYPKADVTPLAIDILQRIKEGKIILSDGSPITEFDWSKAYLGDNSLTDEDGQVLTFSDNPDTEYLLLLRFKSNTIDRNELLYEVADYNFSNYVIQTFDLSFDSDPPYDILQIKGFESFASIRAYLNKALSTNGLINKIDTSIHTIPVSVENYTKVLPRLGIGEYTSFFSETYNELLPLLIAHWDKNKEEVKNLTELQEDALAKKPEDEIEEQQPEKVIAKVILTEPKQEPIEKTKDESVEKQKDSDKQINADDLLTKDQLEKAGKVNDAIETVEDIMSNPVDGIKSLFNRDKYKDSLTKEEKAALKEEEKQEKQRLKELKAIEKAKQDSINRVEKILLDSIQAVEKKKEEQQKLEEQKKKNAEKIVIKAKEDERKNKIRQQEEQQRLQEKERKEKEKLKEAERKEKERQQKERLKKREEERKEKEKAREKERKEKERKAEERRKTI
ncbi:MAG: hypothetical protein ACK5KT_04375 [Dysgonomonas sp.]